MAGLEPVQQHNEDNIFKALEMSIFAKRAEPGDEEIMDIWDQDGIFVPDDYEDLGLTDKQQGATWAATVETSDTTSHGYSSPTRTDITSDVTGLSVTAQETKRIVLELFFGQRIAAQLTASGGIRWDKANLPRPYPVRLLGVAVDGAGDNEVVCGRWLTNALLNDRSDQTWSDSTETNYPLSFNGRRDKTFGVAFREFWGGPGFDPETRGFDLVDTGQEEG